MKKYLLIIFLSFVNIFNIYAQCSATNDVVGNPGQNGLIGEYFAGYFNDVQTFFPSTLSPSLVRVDNNLNFTTNNWSIPRPPATGSAADQDTYSARYRGSINIATAGTYTFYLTSDDASYMFLDNSALAYPTVVGNAFINNGGLHGSNTVSNTMYLSAGFHNIQVLFGENGGSNILTLEYSGPSIARQIVPTGILCTGIQAAMPLPTGCVCNDLQGNAPAMGLLGEYYANYFNDVQTFFTSNTPGLTRLESTLNYNTDNGWGAIVPPATGSVADPNQFSARWTGSVYLPVAGAYTFYLTSDDASYLWINDSAYAVNPTSATASIQNGGTHSPTTLQTTVTLPAGLNNIKIHYGENAGNNRAVLEFENVAANISRQVIPNSLLCSAFKFPHAPVVVTPVTYCQNATAVALTATGVNLLWYTAAVGGLGSATAPIPSTTTVGTTSYYVSQTQGGCESPRAKIDVVVNTTPSLTITNQSACAPSTVDLTAAAVTAGSTGGGVLTYWTNAAATIALATPTSVTAGTYYIKATITATGCSDIKPVVVTINPKPNLVITNPATVCAPTTVDLTLAAVTAGSTGGGVLSYWTDAAATSALATPAAVATGGTYYIKSTIAATGCFDIKSVVVTINPKPNLVITDPAAVCSPSTVNLTAAAVTAGSTGGGVLSYWTNAAATTALATPAAVAVGNTYYIKSTITATGCNDIKPVVVTINPKPNLVITNPATVCAPTTVDLTAAAVTVGSTGGGTLSYWTDAAATLALAIPAAVATGGTYYIKSTTAASCIDIKSVVVTINAKPNLVITDPAAVCSPTTVDLTLAAVTAGSTGGGTLSYWTDAAATSALASPAAVAVGNTYYIKSTITATGCNDIKAVVVTINPKPNLVITDPAAVCAPTTVDLTLAAVTSGSTGGGTLSYWTDAAATSALASPAAVATGGTYYIKSTTAASCIDIKSVVVTINAKPNLVITDPAPTCVTAVDLTAASVTTGSTGGGTLSYWTDATATILLASPNAVTISNTYYIKSTTAAGCTDIKPVVVSANNSPTLNLTKSDICGTLDTGVIRFNTTVAGLAYDYSAGSPYTGSVPPSFDYSVVGVNSISNLTNGTYTVRLQDLPSGCYTDKSITIFKTPNPSLVITDPAAVCSPSTVDITAASVTAGSTGGGTLSYWTDAAATSSLATPNAVSTSATYYIKSTTVAGCADIQPVVVTINSNPSLVITNPAAVCAPSTVDITVPAVTAGSTSGGTLSYWTDAAATASLTSPTAIATANTYYIKLTVPGCFDIKPVVVTINTQPSLMITDPAAVCSPSTVDITAAAVTAGSTGGTTLSYWTDAAATSALASPAAVAVANTYYIKSTITATGCFDIQPVVVTINLSPSLLITDPAAVCAPATVDITVAAVTAGSTGGGTLSYWTDAAATASLATPGAVAGGTYYIKSSTAASCTDIKSVIVTINPKPNLLITDPAAVCAPATVDITVAAVTAGSTSGGTLSYWTDAAATSSLSTPAAITIGNTYYIKSTVGTCFDIQPVVVAINPQPSLMITDPTAVCSPSTVDITAAAVTAGSTGGTTLSYWTDAAATSSLATPTAVGISNTYYIKSIITATGCFDIQPVVVTINPSPSLLITDPAAVCAPATVDITVAAVTAGSTGGGTLSYWTDAAATSALSTPTAITTGNTYYIKSTVGTCFDIQPVVVTINPSPSLLITDPAAVCAPATVDITVAAVTAGSTGGGTLSYWTDAAATASLSTPTAITTSNTYYIKSILGTCSDIQPVIVTIGTTPNLVITDPTPTCTTAVDLTAAAVTAGSTGSGTLSYWTDLAATTALASPNLVTVSNTYYIKSTVGTCFDIKPVVVSANNSPVLNLTNSDICGTLDTGVIRFNTTVAGLAYDYSAGSPYTGSVPPSFDYSVVGVNSISNLTNGTYTVRLQDLPSGCYTDKVITVMRNSNPNLVITDPSACSPSTVNLTIASVTAGSTGSGTLTYWTDAAATASLATPNSVTAGTYYIKSTTVSGCTDIKPVVATVNTSPGLVITDPSPVCIPATVDLTAAAVTAGSSGGGTLTYWTDAAATSTLATPATVGSSGTYYIKTTTPAGCSDIKSVTVAINSNPILAITNPAPVCSPATVDITLPAVTTGSSGGGVLSYWTDAAATSALATPAAVTTGTYYIESTTSGGCIDIKPVNVVVNTSPSLLITDPVSVCTPGTVDITAAAVTAGSTGTGTLTYWTDAAATSPLATPAAVATSGAYYIQLTTAANCTDIKQVNVSIVTAPNLVITDPVATCSTAVDITAAAVTVGSTGGGVLSYWADAAATTALASPNIVTVSGTYYIKSTVGGGCSDIKPVVVSANNGPVYTLSKTDICGTVDNGTISINTATTGYAYDFTGGLSYTGPFSPLSYTLAGTKLIAFGLPSGPYTVRVVDTASSCYIDKTVTINTLSAPTLNLDSTDACESSATGTIFFNLAGNNYKYGYNSGFVYTGPVPPTIASVTGVNTISGLVAGDYTVYLEDTLTGCSVDQSITIHSVLKPTNYTLTGGGTICQGDPAAVLIGMQSSETGVSYQLQLLGVDVGAPVAGTSTSFNFPGSNIGGTYNVIAYVTSVLACSTNISGTVDIISNPKPVIDSIVSSCNGGSGHGVLRVYSTYSAGTLEYSIDNGTFQSSAIFNNLNNGAHSIIIRDNITHCSDTLGQNVFCNTAPIVVDDYNCASVGATVSGNVISNDFEPDGNVMKVTSQNITSAHGGIFKLDTLGNYTYTAFAGYQGADTITYVVCDSVPSPLCTSGNLILLIGNKKVVATYDTASTLENTAMTSSVSIFANDTVSVGNSIVFTVVNNKTTEAGGLISIDSLGNYTYSPALNYYGTDKFIYTIFDRCGNSDTAVMYIAVKAILPVFIPEGFSPGGAHPTFVIYNAERYNVSFKVYNRWGSLVYAKDDYKAPDWWNGTSNQGLSIGEVLPDGTYFYTIDLNNGTKIPAGYIVIKR